MDTVEAAQWVLRIALAVTFIVMGISHFVPGSRARWPR